MPVTMGYTHDYMTFNGYAASTESAMLQTRLSRDIASRSQKHQSPAARNRDLDIQLPSPPRKTTRMEWSLQHAQQGGSDASAIRGALGYIAVEAFAYIKFRLKERKALKKHEKSFSRSGGD